MPAPLALLLGAALAVDYSVTADVLRVRSSPGTDASVVAWLRAGTEVSSDRFEGNWAKVTSARHRHLSGWVHTDFLSEIHDETEHLAAAALAEEGGEAAARAWFDRDPARAADVLRPIDPDRVARWEAAPTWIAGCVPGGTTLLGKLESDGTFHPVAGWTKEQLDAVRADLAGAAWYATDRYDDVVLPGTPFPAPRVQLTDHATGNMLEGPWLLSLGRCAGSLVATRPLREATPAGLPLDDLITAAQHVTESLDGPVTEVGARRISPDLPIYEASAMRPSTAETGDLHPWVVQERVVAVVRPDGTPLAERRALELNGEVTWAEVRHGGLGTWVGFVSYQEPEGHGGVLFVVRKGEVVEVESTTITTWEGGC